MFNPAIESMIKMFIATNGVKLAIDSEKRLFVVTIKGKQQEFTFEQVEKLING